MYSNQWDNQIDFVYVQSSCNGSTLVNIGGKVAWK